MWWDGMRYSDNLLQPLGTPNRCLSAVKFFCTCFTYLQHFCSCTNSPIGRCGLVPTCCITWSPHTDALLPWVLFLHLAHLFETLLQLHKHFCSCTCASTNGNMWAHVAPQVATCGHTSHTQEKLGSLKLPLGLSHAACNPLKPSIHTYMHTYTHTWIHTYTHTYIHT